MTHAGVAYTIVMLPLMIGAFADVPRALQAGPISAMGLLSIGQAGIMAAAVLACRGYPRRLVLLLIPYGLFLAWAGCTALWASPTFGGVQNGVVYMLFGLSILFTGTIASRSPRTAQAAIDFGVSWMDRVGLSLAFLCLVTRGLPYEEGQWFVGARAFALTGLIPLSWHVAHWHSGQNRRLIRASLWLTAIGLSLSRTALAIAFLYVALALLLQIRFNPRLLLSKLPAGVLGVGVSAAFIFNTGALQERTFTGDTSLQMGGLAINMSGRLNMWPVVIASAQESPLIGKGLGSSQEAVRVFDYIGHPHNDYLRVWHDMGAVGLTLLLAAVCSWLACLQWYWRTSGWHRQPHAPMEMAALLALLGLGLAAFTDNAVIYPFVMGPLGVMVGAGLGAGGYRRRHVGHH